MFTFTSFDFVKIEVPDNSRPSIYGKTAILIMVDGNSLFIKPFLFRGYNRFANNIGRTLARIVIFYAYFFSVKPFTASPFTYFFGRLVWL